MRKIAAEVLYRVGRTLSWLDNNFFGHLYFERGRFVINCSLYPIYNRLFIWSADLTEQH
jgi:hypothetical protein